MPCAPTACCSLAFVTSSAAQRLREVLHVRSRQQAEEVETVEPHSETTERPILHQQLGVIPHGGQGLSGTPSETVQI